MLCANGTLINMWSFDGNLEDRLQRASSGNYSSIFNDTEKNCEQYVVAGGEFATVILPNVSINLNNDFAISFYMRIPKNQSGENVILSLGRNYTEPNIHIRFANDSLSWVVRVPEVSFQLKFPGETLTYDKWRLITLLHNGTFFSVRIDDKSIASIFVNTSLSTITSSLILGGCEGCNKSTMEIHYDEMHVFDNAEDPYTIFHEAHCIQTPPQPKFAAVDKNHMWFKLTYLSYYAQFSSPPPVFTFTINRMLYTANFVVKNDALPTETYEISLHTNWSLSSPKQSNPMFLYPVGHLRHAWPFEGEYDDVVSGFPAATSSNYPTFVSGVCGQAMQTTPNNTLHYNLTDMAYQNDFTVAFWMFLAGNESEDYAIINTRPMCEFMDLWSLRY
jgi:hypothetical protein